jgi:hypothetical protein
MAQKLGQLEAVHRDLQPKYWANLKRLGQPCNAHATPPRPRAAPGLDVRRRLQQLGRLAQGVKVTGLAQKLGQLEAVNRDLQSNIGPT